MIKEKDIKIGFVLDLHGRTTNPIARLDNYIEAILNKVEYILKNNDVIIFMGDVINTYIVGTHFINKLLILLIKYELQGKVIKFILGNHDIIGRKYHFCYETSIGTILIGRNWLIKKYYMYEKYTDIVFHSLMFKEDGTSFVTPPIKDKINILLGHSYFKHPEFNDKWNIDEDILKGYDYCVLGHDHQYYDIEEYYNCKLLRSGSISRATIDDKDRIPQYPQICITLDENNSIIKQDCQYIKVPFEPAESVFKIKEDVLKNLEKHKKDINRMIELLNVQNLSKEDLSLKTALKNLECPIKYQNIIEEVLNE